MNLFLVFSNKSIINTVPLFIVIRPCDIIKLRYISNFKEIMYQTETVIIVFQDISTEGL